MTQSKKIMIRIVLAYLMLGVFIGTERRLRRGQTALNLDAVPADRGSTRIVGAAFGIMVNVMLLAPLLNRRRVGQVHSHYLIPWLGIPLMLSGILLRVWAHRTLGEFYTRTLVTTEQQQIVKVG